MLLGKWRLGQLMLTPAMTYAFFSKATEHIDVSLLRQIAPALCEAWFERGTRFLSAYERETLDKLAQA